MRTFLIKTLILSFVLVPSLVLAEAKTLEIDTKNSVVKWLGKKVTGQHDGVVRLKDGKVIIENGQVKDGEFVIDMMSIVNNDIDSQEYRAKLENHLKSDDFFNVSQFAIAKFDIEKVTAVEGDPTKQEVAGTLTVKGIEKPLSFIADVNEENGKYKANAKITLDRTKWDIRYNSSAFFDVAKLGDKLIYDDIEIELNLITN